MENFKFTQPGGASGYLGLTINAMVSMSGESAGFVLLGRDVTDTRKLEEAAFAAQQQLILVDKMSSLGVMAAGIAHEINNPNNFIMFNSRTLMEIWKDIEPVLVKYHGEMGEFTAGGLGFVELRPAVARLFEGIVEGTQRIDNMIKMIKDFAREEERGEKSPIDLNNVVNRALKFTRHLINLSTDHFSVQYAHDVPTVRGNFQELEQVVINLVTNALQALPDRSKAVKIAVSCNKEVKQVSITVTDEGIGIRPENMSKLFEPFFTTRIDKGGTGLGLSISHKVVREHGGTMHCVSEPGKGTAIRVTLPCARCENA